MTQVIAATPLPGNLELAEVIAENCTVLLRNRNHALPLVPTDRVAIAGLGVLQFQTGVAGASKVNPGAFLKPDDAMREGAKAGFFLMVDSAANGNQAFPDLAELEKIRKEADTIVVWLSRSAKEGADLVDEEGGYRLSAEE